MRILITALAAGMLAAGCSHLPWPAGVPEAGIPKECPEVLTAEAWINRMPGPSAPGAALIVNLRLASEEPWMLRETAPRDASDPRGTLQLELLPGGSGHPGNAAWRGQDRAAARSVDIFCQGRIHHRIGDITTAG